MFDRDRALKAAGEGRGVVAVVGGLAMALIMVPGLCPACWPGYLGLAASVGLAASAPGGVSTPVFAAMLAAAVLALGVQVARRRDALAGLAAACGALLVIEARLLGGLVHLHLTGTALLIGAAVVATARPVRPASTLVQIAPRKEVTTCEKRS